MPGRPALPVAAAAPLCHDGQAGRSQDRWRTLRGKEAELSELMIEAADFRAILGNYPTGVAAITAMTEAGVPVGFVVGTFT